MTKTADAPELDFDMVKHRSAVGVASFLVRMVFLQLVTFVSSVFVSRFLGPFAFGVYGIVANFVFLFIYFSDVGLAAALVQKKNQVKEKRFNDHFYNSTIAGFNFGSNHFYCFTFDPAMAEVWY